MSILSHECNVKDCVYCSVFAELQDCLKLSESLLEIHLGTGGEQLKNLIAFHRDNDLTEQASILGTFDSKGEIPILKPPLLHQDWWELIFSKKEYHSSTLQRMGKVSLILHIICVCNSSFHLENKNFSQALGALGMSHSWLGSAIAYLATHYGDDSPSMRAKYAVSRKLQSDPKQKAKQQVRECWDIWKGKPSRYKSKSAFARDMLSKYEQLESSEVIQRWCREWESELSKQS